MRTNNRWTIAIAGVLIGAATLMIVAFVVLMCYGGGFGTMPAFAADYFGSKNVGPIYGLMLTAWGSASAVGPLLIAYMRETTGFLLRRASCDCSDNGAFSRASTSGVAPSI